MTTINVSSVVPELLSIHTVGSLASSHGGPSRTVPALARAVAQCDASTHSVVVSYLDAPPSSPLTGVERFRLCSTSKGEEVKTIESCARKEHLGAHSVILHDHGQWHRINRASAKVARRTRCMRVVSPRGMLSPWSMKHKRWKKRLAWALFAKRDLQSASAIHATSELEAEELRALGVVHPIILLPNGIDERDHAWLTDANIQAPRFTDGTTKPYALFLSRIHIKKGILDLLKVWDRIRPNTMNLVIAGHDEQGLLQNRNLPPGCHYVGVVEGETKAQWMRHARVFLLPTYSENFGIAVAESMIAGVPVLTTTGTPWKILPKIHAGWCVEPGEQVLERNLREILQVPDATLRAMGERGRAYAESSFSWPSIGSRMLAAYRWLTRDSSIPDCVLLK